MKIYVAIKKNQKHWNPTTKIYLAQCYLLNAIGKTIIAYINNGKKETTLNKNIEFYGIDASMVTKCLRKPPDREKDEWKKYKEGIMNLI